MSRPIITILTDFGIEDAYVAVMKGVMLTICREACLIDVTHSIPPQDIRTGAYMLRSAYAYFPEGTVHLAVVDPGVGTERKALVMEASGHFFVGPDNGLFTWILKDASKHRAFNLENKRYWRPEISKTFHGRDVFAPVAAHLAKGVPIASFGTPCAPYIAEWSVVTRTDEGLQGQVIYIDHFGNAITSLTRKEIEGSSTLNDSTVRIGGHRIPYIVDTYGARKPGGRVALMGSTGHLEVAVTQGNAAKELGIQIGMAVSVHRRHDAEPPDQET